MNRELVEIIAEYALFLEKASEAEISLETAVRQEEDLAYRLQKLSMEDRQTFIETLAEVANDFPVATDRQILLALPDAFGIR